MAECKLTRDAERDLANIADYTIENFGLEQAKNYRDELFNTFKLLTQNPQMGSDFSLAREGVRRHAHRKHSIYYKTTESGILVLRLLHERQDPASNL